MQQTIRGRGGGLTLSSISFALFLKTKRIKCKKLVHIWNIRIDFSGKKEIREGPRDEARGVPEQGRKEEAARVRRRE